MRAPVLIGIIVALHILAVSAIITMQGCGTTSPQQVVEPPPAPVMPPHKETVLKPKPVIQPPVPIEPAPSMLEPSGNKTYIVQKGDSLSKIAARCGVSAREIMELNKIKDANKVRIGQKLVLPDYANLSGVAVSKPAPAKEKASSKPHKEVKSVDGAYVVQPGDSLSKIAAKNGTTVKAIKETNQLKNDKILVGQKLAMPGAKAEKKEKAEEPKVEPTPTPVPEAAATAVPEPVMPLDPVPAPPQPQSAAPALSSDAASQSQPLEYTVQEGESLEDIAKLFIVRKEDIVKLNDLAPGQSLRAGQKIKIPSTSL